MLNIIDIILPTFFAILIGYLVGKLTKINIAPVTDITLYIGVPALVFVSLTKQDIVLADAAKIWAASLIITIGCMLVAWLVFKATGQKHSGLYVPIGVMNTVNIPFPIVSLAYGAPGLAAATLFNIPNNLFVFTVGTGIMTRKHWRENIKEVFRLPVIYASILGLILNLLDVPVPSLVLEPLAFISQLAGPLVLITLGFNISKAKMTAIPTSLLASFLRMGVGLGIGLLIVQALDITGVFRSIVILDSVMPAAAMSSILATKYDNEAELVSSVVFVTTLASLVVIPVLLNVLG